MIVMKCVALLSIILSIYVCDDTFSSTEVIKRLLTKEHQLLNHLKESIKHEEKRLEKLKALAAQLVYLHQYRRDEETIDKYIGNPINAFTTIWRLLREWKEIYDKLNSPDVIEFNKAYLTNEMPTKNDEEGALNALLRLQNFYEISSEDMARGIIPGVHSRDRNELNLQQIFAIGNRAYHIEEWALQKQWMEYAVEQLGARDEIEGIQKIVVMDFLAYAEYKLGNFERAIEITEDYLLKVDPENKRFKTNVQNYLKWINQTKEDQKKFIGKPKGEIRLKYERLCRGESREQTREEMREMKCWYERKNPILRYMPQKMEKAWTNPDIFILRNTLVDADIQKLQEATKFKLRRAGLHGYNLSSEKTNDRTSKNAWLKVDSYHFLQRMEKVAEAVFNLNMSAAEKLQVGNYGIGGHYNVHFDWARENEDQFTNIGMGNRIATILYYLSDVEAGGATAFIDAETAIFPSKGDAVFWMNLKRNGRGDVRTNHAGCPVLVGSKWVANWWIHEHGQEFRMPCLLDPNL